MTPESKRQYVVVIDEVREELERLRRFAATWSHECVAASDAYNLIDDAYSTLGLAYGPARRIEADYRPQ